MLLSPTIVAPLAIFILDRDNYVRFYALQAMIGVVAFVALTSGLNILNFAPALRPFIGLANGIMFLVGFIVWLMLVYRSWQGIEWEIPILGGVSKRLIGRI